MQLHKHGVSCIKINKTMKKRYRVLTINTIDYKLISIGDMESGLVICHLNLMDNDFNEMLVIAEKMCDMLNCS